MRTDAPAAMLHDAIRADYWDIPEVATLLSVVAHLNFGAAIAVCLWAVSLAWGGTLPRTTGAAAPTARKCECEQLILTPVAPARRQLAVIENTRS